MKIIQKLNGCEFDVYEHVYLLQSLDVFNKHFMYILYEDM